MPARSAYDYAIVRVVPRVERGEFVNAGAIVHCRARAFLGARVVFDRGRLAALFPAADLDAIRAHLEAIPVVATGGAPAGAIGALSTTERFHWLVAPRSTIVQTSPVHVGLCDEPNAALDDLMRRYVTL